MDVPKEIYQAAIRQHDEECRALRNRILELTEQVRSLEGEIDSRSKISGKGIITILQHGPVTVQWDSETGSVRALNNGDDPSEQPGEGWEYPDNPDTRALDVLRGQLSMYPEDYDSMEVVKVAISKMKGE